MIKLSDNRSLKIVKWLCFQQTTQNILFFQQFCFLNLLVSTCFFVRQTRHEEFT